MCDRGEIRWQGSRAERLDEDGTRQSLIHALAYSTAHRRLKKRTNRSLQIVRINAAARANGINYANLIHGMSLAGIELDRKSLAELAIREPEGFSEVVKLAQTALPA